MPVPAHKREKKVSIVDGFLTKLSAFCTGPARRYIFLTVLGVMAASFFLARNLVVGDVHPGTPMLWPDSRYNLDTDAIDRVALYMQNSPQFMLAYYAVLRADAMVVPVNPMNVAAELSYMLRDSGARVLLAAQERYGQVAPLLESGVLTHTIDRMGANGFHTRGKAPQWGPRAQATDSVGEGRARLGWRAVTWTGIPCLGRKVSCASGVGSRPEHGSKR